MQDGRTRRVMRPIRRRRYSRAESPRYKQGRVYRLRESDAAHRSKMHIGPSVHSLAIGPTLKILSVLA